MAKKTTLKEIADMLTHVVKHMATKEDLAAAETRLGDRIDGLKVKVEGLQNQRDAEALRRTDEKIPDRVGTIEKHLGINKKIAA